ncbi:MAG: ABC transporter ATP-binding protein [Promethearchaeota archaeon]|jgi:ABC-type multidrug transport system fused ATPase/permease subunit
MWFGLDAEDYDKKISDKVLLKRIVKYFGNYKRPMIIVISFMTVSSIFRALVPVLTTVAINNLGNNSSAFFIFLIILLIFGLNSLGWVFNYFRQLNMSQVVGNVMLDLRRDAGSAVLDHDLSFFDKHPIGKIVSRINTDSRDLSQTVQLTLDVISSLFVIIFVLSFMIFMNLTLLLITIISVPLFFALALSFRKIARSRSLLGQRALASVNAYVKESFSGIQIAKTFRQEDKLYENFNEVNNISYKVNLHREYILNIMFPVLSVIQGTVLTLIIYYGGGRVLDGSISAGDLNLFLQGLSYLFMPLLTIATFWPAFQTGMASSERIFALIDTLPVVVQKNNIKPPRLKGGIEFNNVSFSYEVSNEVFEDFSLKINPGESVAIVGHTGAGKSSLAKLISRFYEFQRGKILIDGVNIRDFDLKEYRKQIGIIPQTPFLWAETIENNIKYCNKMASKEDVNNVLTISSGTDWIDDVSNGLETNVGERGRRLSMGQRQLVVFARVILEDPAILILDEATASVDPFTETRIQEALQKTIEGRTSIIIAHRLWTVRHVDRIIVLDQGKIVEEGNHDDLMAKGGTYAELYNTYFRHQSLEYIEKMKEPVQYKT